MKKLTKSSLSQMAALLPELDEEDQRSILGGTATTATPPDYTGNVPVPSTVVTGSYDVTGCYPSSTSAPTGASQAPTGGYTFEEMDRMIDNGTWMGGYVDGMGYVGEAVIVTGYYQGLTGTANTLGETFSDFCSDVWDWTVDSFESTVNEIVHVGSQAGSAIAEGVTYGYLDFKYNGSNAGNGIGKIPIEKYLEVKDEYHAYRFSFEKGLWREDNKLPDNPTYSDVREMINVVTLPGFVRVESGYKCLDFIIGFGANKGIHYGIDNLLDLGEPK